MSESSADKLLARMREWAVHPGNSSIMDSRAVDGVWWPPHVETFNWILDVEQQIEQAREDNPELDGASGVMDAVRRSFFGCGNSLLSPLGKVTLFSDESIASLSLLTVALNAIYKSGIPLDAVDLFTMTDELESLIDGTPNLDDSVRDYLVCLVEQLREAIQACVINGKDNVRDLVDQLIGAMARYTYADNPKKFKDVMNRFGRATAKFLAVDVPREIGVGLSTALITKQAGL